jgi:guanylate kinase
VGKDTVINEWRKRDPRVERVVAYTTRTPRVGEADGIDYRFVSREDFKRLADSGHFLEFKQVHDNFYATPLKDMDRLLAEGKIAVLKIDVQGAQTVLQLMPDTLDVFLLPPAWADLKERIIARGLNTEEEIEHRLQNARLEISRSREYRHRFVNKRVEDVVDRLAALVASTESQ